MKILKALKRINALFAPSGKPDLTEDNAMFLDTILIIMAAGEGRSTDTLHLELLRCGFFVTYPELNEALDHLEKEGFIDTEKRSPKPKPDWDELLKKKMEEKKHDPERKG